MSPRTHKFYEIVDLDNLSEYERSILWTLDQHDAVSTDHERVIAITAYRQGWRHAEWHADTERLQAQ